MPYFAVKVLETVVEVNEYYVHAEDAGAAKLVLASFEDCGGNVIDNKNIETDIKHREVLGVEDLSWEEE